MMRIEVIFNPGTSIEHLEDIEFRMRNQEPMVLGIGLVLSNYMAMNFASGGQGRWPPLAASTLARKAAQGYPPDMLVRTGELEDSVSGGEWQVGRVGGDFIGVLDVAGHGGFHIEGTDFMPARDFTFIPDSVEAEIGAVAEEWLFGGIF